MRTITKEDLGRLASKDAEPPVISVYLPVASLPDDTRKNDIRLKNAIAAAHAKLESAGVDEDPAGKILEPLRYWQSEGGLQPDSGPGAVMFIEPGDASLFRLPVQVPELTIVGDRFCLKPAIAAVSVQASFLLLALARNSVTLYRGRNDSLEPIVLPDDVPRSMSDAVGRELSDPQLQHHAGSTGSESAIYHGHGAGKDEQDSEQTRFLKVLDEALRRNGFDGTPLVLAGVDDITAEYRRISEYEPILPSTVSGSPDSYDERRLAQAARETYQADTRQRRLHELEGLQSGDIDRATTTDPDEIVVAAHYERIERLFIAADREYRGRYDPAEREPIALDADEPDAVDLLDLPASAALASGADLVALPADAFGSGRVAAAVLRYRADGADTDSAA